jgi:LPXTG-motif cell wall-anchored protein
VVPIVALTAGAAFLTTGLLMWTRRRRASLD